MYIRTEVFIRPPQRLPSGLKGNGDWEKYPRPYLPIFCFPEPHLGFACMVQDIRGSLSSRRSMSDLLMSYPVEPTLPNDFRACWNGCAVMSLAGNSPDLICVMLPVSYLLVKTSKSSICFSYNAPSIHTINHIDYTGYLVCFSTTLSGAMFCSRNAV